MNDLIKSNHSNEKTIKNANIIRWCILCIVVFLISIFIHECGHGFSNSLREIECSTGFNRVGDIYKYPKEVDFRAEYSSVSDSLLDFGVPVTLLLAIIGTGLFYIAKGEKSRIVTLAVAATNSIMRLIPCLFVVMTPLLTGKIHNEDEFGTGLALVKLTGVSWFTYLPALLSIFISVICIMCLYRKLKVKMSNKKIRDYGSLTLFCFLVSMIIANTLDNIIRINWIIR
jgi:hypothetical protein